MNFTQFNKTNRIDWGFDSSKLPFKKLSEILGAREFVYVQAKGFFITLSKFGKQANMITDTAILNLPSHLAETIETILNNAEAIDAIKKGECWVRLYTYHSKTYNRDFAGVDFVDTDEVFVDDNNDNQQF